MDFIEEFSPKSTCNLVHKLQVLSVRGYEGENVRLVYSTLKGAYEVLHNHDSVPSDLVEIGY